MDLLLSEFLKAYPRVGVVQPKNLFYGTYRNRIRLHFLHNYETRRCQRDLLYCIDNEDAADEICTRAENRRLSIFYNNDKTFQAVIDTLKKIYISKEITAENRIYEITYDRIGLARKTLHVPTVKNKGFNYKVTLKTGWNKFDPESKDRLYNILSQDWNNCKLTPATFAWLTNPQQTSNWAGKYFYVKESALITFMQLGCSDIIDQVYEII